MTMIETIDEQRYYKALFLIGFSHFDAEYAAEMIASRQPAETDYERKLLDRLADVLAVA
jgi:hypothetical protein